jgi:dTDP-4-dehydrorhamnose 3,5-epimerase-like enzyme
MEQPYSIPGDLYVDDRGTLSFVNAFNFEGIRRFYLVTNHNLGFVRAWHAHKREAKHVVAVEGSAIVAAVKIDDWEHPSRDLPVHRFVLSADKPAIVCIPPGYANGFMTLTANAKLMFFSTATLEESRDDDFRYEPRYWDPWRIAER